MFDLFLIISYIFLFYQRRFDVTREAVLPFTSALELLVLAESSPNAFLWSRLWRVFMITCVVVQGSRRLRLFAFTDDWLCPLLKCDTAQCPPACQKLSCLAGRREDRNWIHTSCPYELGCYREDCQLWSSFARALEEKMCIWLGLSQECFHCISYTHHETALCMQKWFWWTCSCGLQISPKIRFHHHTEFPLLWLHQ